MASKVVAVTALLSAISLVDVHPALLQMCMISHLHAIHFANRFFRIVDYPCKIRKLFHCGIIFIRFHRQQLSAWIGFTIKV